MPNTEAVLTCYRALGAIPGMAPGAPHQCADEGAPFPFRTQFLDSIGCIYFNRGEVNDRKVVTERRGSWPATAAPAPPRPMRC